jgi:hypothetical protein
MTEDVPIRFDLRISRELGLALQEFRRRQHPVVPSALDALRVLIRRALEAEGIKVTGAEK